MMPGRWLWCALLLSACDGASTDVSGPSPGPAAIEPAAAEASPAPEAGPSPTAAPEPAARPTDPAQFVGHHVLVRAGAKLLLSPTDGAGSIDLRVRLPEDDGPYPTRAMRVVGHAGGLLEVRGTAEDERCSPGLGLLDDFDLRLFVAPTDLARVLARPQEASFADGTRIVLKPGVAVGEPGDRVEVDAAGLRFALEIPETEIGTMYAPDVLDPPAEGAEGLSTEAVLRVDGRTVGPGSSLFTGGGGIALLADRSVGGQRYARVGNRCATLEAIVEGGGGPPEPRAAALASLHGAGIASLLGGPIETTYSVAPGAKIVWPDGTEIGEVRRARTFQKADVAKGGKGRRCFSIALDPASTGDAVRLCFARADVTVHEAVDPYASFGGLSGLGGAGSFGALEETDIYGGLLGAELSDEALGAGGLAIVGGGRGGGGTGEGTIGLGNIGTLGHGAGGGSGSGYGSGFGSRGSKISSTAKVAITSTTGELDREAIERVLKRNRAQIRFCYEKALLASPDLSGTVTLSFTVDAAGDVTTASADGVSTEVASCVAKIARRMKLPTASAITVVKATATFATE